MKSLIHTYQIDDVNICDELINYHNNNIVTGWLHFIL